MRQVVVVTLCSLTALLGGCARQISPNVYSEASIGETSQTFRGTIINARNVMVEGKEKLDQNAMGLVGGGVAGGLVGNQFGGGTGNLAMTAVGAAAGALGGALLQKELEKQDAIEYTVELHDGTLKTIVQGPEPRFQTGQKILLIVYDGKLINNNKGRSRIVADTSVS